jgi:hypothetical protein
MDFRANLDNLKKRKISFSLRGVAGGGLGSVVPPPQAAESKGDGKINIRHEQI